VPATRASHQGMRCGSPRHGIRTTIRAQGSAADAMATSRRPDPPSQPAQMMHGPAAAVVASSAANSTNLAVVRRTSRAMTLTSTARLGEHP